MFTYLARRVALMIPTLFGISLVVFAIINLAPGSPVDQKIQAIRFSMAQDGQGSGASASAFGRGDQVVSQEVVDALRRQYGFDKPLLTRYGIWLRNLAVLDFGKSFSYEEPVIDVIRSKFPVSLQFGIASFLLTYLICIPLGIVKAYKNGELFDAVSGFFLVVAYSVPPFMLGVLLIVFLGGGSFYDWFPIGGLVSDNHDALSAAGRIADRIHHFVLPLVCFTLGSFTSFTLLVKNSVLDEIGKDYVRTARAKGLTEKAVYLKHALRNALIPVATGLGSFLSVFFAGSILIETIFQLDGIGLLGYKAVLSRDYNVIMALVFLQSAAYLAGSVASDLIYVIVDPRIDFS